MRAIEENVHIHAEARAVYLRLAALESLGESLPELFRSANAGAGAAPRSVVAQPALGAGCMPLVVAQAEEPHSLTLVPVGGGTVGSVPSIESLRWELQPEGACEVHLTLAADYRTPAGIAGPLLDLLVYRPRRRQALRDALWRLKGLVEERPAP